MVLYLFNYNNYYNRLIKGENAVVAADIISDIEGVVRFDNINFNPNDNVRTTQILNTNIEADYCLVCDNTGTIISRWFVMEATRLRNGQWEYSLKRDSISDYYLLLKNSPVFIEKATLDSGDPFIYNSEDMTYNQIKNAETLLKREKDIPWYVLYVKHGVTHEIKIDLKQNLPIESQIINAGSLASWQYYKHCPDNAAYQPLQLSTDFSIDISALRGAGQTTLVFSTNLTNETSSKQLFGYQVNTGLRTNDSSISFVEEFKNSSIKYDYGNFNTKYYENLPDLNDKVLRVGIAGAFTYYKITVKELSTQGINRDYITSSNGGTLFNTINTIATSKLSGSAGSQSYQIINQYKEYAIYLSVLTNTQSVPVTFSVSQGKVKTNENYQLVMIPADACVIDDGTRTFDMTRETATDLLNSFIGSFGADLLDAQLLPYSNVDQYIQATVENGKVKLKDTSASSKYSQCLYSQDNKLVGAYYLIPEVSFTFDIDYAVDASSDAIERKVQSECDMYRIVSPNYNGQFEFNVAKNGGLSSFNVDVTLKPYTPYIHINPDFGGLYGKDFNDCRGLICGGDFSVTQYQDQWINYQIQNKNYQQIFDRQIQNMEVQNRFQQTADIFSAIGGAGQSAALGSFLGGGAIGAGIAGGVGAAAGIADIFINRAMRQETLDYTKDQFGYQLQNIQALPYNLTKVSAININNKIFPVVEYYTCSEQEKEALRSKIRYNGMTVMRIGTIEEFRKAEPTYIKGKLIRCEELNGDYHALSDIAAELNQGVFI